MKSNLWNIFLNIVIVVAALFFIGFFIDMLSSFAYRNRDVGDPAAEKKMVFEYELKHKAYDEMLRSYYTDRLDSFEPEAGREDLHRVAAYAHAAFMSKIYEETGDKNKAGLNTDKMNAAKNELGEYAYTADDIDALVGR